MDVIPNFYCISFLGTFDHGSTTMYLDSKTAYSQCFLNARSTIFLYANAIDYPVDVHRTVSQVHTYNYIDDIMSIHLYDYLTRDCALIIYNYVWDIC